MLLSIIIVNYNVKYFVEQCLNSIYRSEDVPLDDVEVYVIDNSSRDGSVEYLRQAFKPSLYPRVHIVANKRNVGFGRANNQALAKSHGKYVLFLNPDTLLAEHTLRDVLAEAEKINDLGAMGIKMLHTNGAFALESRRGIPSPWVSFCKMTGLTALFPHSKFFGRYYMRYLSTEQLEKIDIVSGAFMLTTAAALKVTGKFDETFFMYGEDIDLSCRFLKKGFTNYYCPTSFLHYKGESTQKNSFRYVHVFYEAMLIFFRKHYAHYHFLLSLPIKIAIVLRALLALIGQQMTYLRKFLFPRSMRENQRMLYIGRSSDMVKQLEEEYGLNIDYLNADEETMPQGHLAMLEQAKGYSHIVYDLEDFRIDKVLSLFEGHVLPKVHIGTFSPHRCVLITTGHTYVKD